MLRNIVRWMACCIALMTLLPFASCTSSENKADTKAGKNVSKPTTSETPAPVVTIDPGPMQTASTKTDTRATSENSATAETNETSQLVQTPVAGEQTFKRPQPRQRPKLPPPEDAQRLSPDFDVWIDPKAGVVIVDGEISLREGMLEMFACTRNTKEHESVISANTLAFLVHAGLLRLGALTGHPVQFEPEYRPPSGTEIDIKVQWRDANGQEKSARAQEMIQDIRTKEAMKHPFVFAGSLFVKDQETGREFYMAESGDFICVSNFASAMLDIPVQSSQLNESLEFVAFTEHIPPLGTPVRMILKPKLKEDEKSEKKTAEKLDGEPVR